MGREAALCRTPRRRLARKTSEVSVASDMSLDFAVFAQTPVPGQPVAVTPAQCGLLAVALLMAPRPTAVGAQGQATAAARSVLKRPASNAKKCITVDSAVARGVPGGVSVRYAKMWYKNTGACAVREVGGKQLLQVVVRGATREQVEDVADQCLEKLHAGADVVAVKQWVVEAKERLKQCVAASIVEHAS